MFDYRAANLTGRLQLLACIRTQVFERQTPSRFSGFTCVAGDLVAAAHSLEHDRNGFALAVPHDVEMNGRAWLLLPDLHLQFTRIGDGLSIKTYDHVAILQTSFRGWRIGLYLRDQRPFTLGKIEEL